ncbi:hypothetical protein BDV3_002507 [Batrachochytrium dendrobatidis]|uniref:Monothiol glutaredoxin-5, mitochondrial n=1 Tax=Batrachochytrium dendrobatidis (strain JEL423) TaxID=403673 RepID=A0A177WW10_BATDL|nr:monothiol glutaredoxin grx5 [Batrachochytrium dendrobatidis]KAK5667703.1 monothiol glutaredoxin grx5 [Batrachochytrium dendrobatidis]OAJ44253.1 Grx4 family monothiol glutaredoxin [Batrachochytrium dendrobatidis JEL423]
MFGRTARLLSGVQSPLIATRTAAFKSQLAVNHILHRNISDKLRSQIDKAVKEHPVVVFMKGNKASPQCGFSRAVIQILDLQGVKDFKTVNVLSDSEVREGIKEYTSWPTIPQVFLNGEFIGGSDILISMHQSGELETMLAKEGIIEAPEQEPTSK